MSDDSDSPQKGMISRLGDRRYKERQWIEEVYDLKTVASIVATLPISKAYETALLFRWEQSARFALGAVLAFLAVTYTPRLLMYLRQRGYTVDRDD